LFTGATIIGVTIIICELLYTMKHMNSIKTILGMRPIFANSIGRTSIPLPMHVPDISIIAPVCFCIIFSLTKDIQKFTNNNCDTNDCCACNQVFIIQYRIV
jgi:hypothetical protein